MEVPIPLLLLAAGLAGGGLWVTVSHLRLRGELRRLDDLAERRHRERWAVQEELEAWRLEGGDLRHVLHDSQRRWSWAWDRFPLHASLADVDGEGSSWLLEHAPSDWTYLGAGVEATDRLAIQPFTGWRPPRIQNGKGRSASRARRG